MVALQCAALPALNQHRADETVSYDENGLAHRRVVNGGQLVLRRNPSSAAIVEQVSRIPNARLLVSRAGVISEW